MEETYNVKAIILNRRDHGEGDGRITAYSLERGKLELTARGMKKIKSKLAGHLEPITLANLMAVRGRQYDYVGAAVSQDCYGGIKNDLAKLTKASEAVSMVDRLIKPGVADGELFTLLKDYLDELEADQRGIITSCFFILKLLAQLGHAPELFFCVNCGKKILPGKNKFDLAKGGLVGAQCLTTGTNTGRPISDDAIKILRLALKLNFKDLKKIKISKKLESETEKIIKEFYKYNF
jgi:DNA repair protein RecO (recombination protein O)